MRGVHTEYYVRLKDRLEASPQGQRGGIVAEAAAFMGCKASTIYRKLEQVGWSSGRKVRSDRGGLCVDEDLAIHAAGMIKTATRANGKKTLPLTTVVGIMRDNGMGVIDMTTGFAAMPSPSTVARSMRVYGCHPKQIEKGSPAQSLRSLHPNHTWEMDASVCIVFYLPKGKVRIMEEDKYYKNKPRNLEKAAKERVIRWVITDHNSGTLFVRYMLGNEDAASAISVLIEAMCKREAEGDVFHGVPFILYSDKGAPFVSGLMQTFLKRVHVRHISHAAGNARATGQVENGQNIVETQFEGRLRFLEIDSLEELNRHAMEWQVAWNATAIHRRHKTTRNRMWLTITPEQLRVPESVAALQAIVQDQGKPRKVPPTLILSYAPKGFERHTYSLTGIPGIVIGQSIGVCVNPFEAPAVDIIVTAPNGEETVYTIQPIERDRAGFDVTAPIIGEEMRALKDTATDKAIKRMDKEAYGTATLEEAAKAKKAGRRAYEGMNIMADVEATKVPLYFPARGTGLSLDAPARELAPMNLVEAATQLRGILAGHGIEWEGRHMEHLSARYPGGVPHETIEALTEEFLSWSIPQQPEYGRLRLAVGGAA